MIDARCLRPTGRGVAAHEDDVAVSSQLVETGQHFAEVVFAVPGNPGHDIAGGCFESAGQVPVPCRRWWAGRRRRPSPPT